MSDDDNIYESVRNERNGTYSFKTKREIRNDPKIVKRNKRDWVLGDDGVGHDTIVGEEWVEEDR